MQGKRIDLSSWLIGGEVVGASFGETPAAQRTRLLGQIEKFFAHKGQIVALEADTSHFHTKAHLENDERLEQPIYWGESNIRISTQFKVFDWNFDEGLLNIVVSDDVLSFIHDVDGGSVITQFIRW